MVTFQGKDSGFSMCSCCVLKCVCVFTPQIYRGKYVCTFVPGVYKYHRCDFDSDGIVPE